MPSATNLKLAAQSVRAITKMRTLSPEECRLLQANPADVATLTAVLTSYERANPFHAGHGDVPLKLRRAIRLLSS